MSYKLIIVESPTKVNSLSKFLKPATDYKIASSMGHIRDLPSNKMNIDIENQFKPNYAISPSKQKIVTELKKLAKGASEVIMASDEDREGEAIAWHICHILKLDPKETKRIVFHEITKSALEQALSEPRTIDQDLVDAQQARRIMDRIVGYEISPLLWQKIAKGLSAGRVQSVAVRLIYEREQEIQNYQPEISIQSKAIFSLKDQSMIANLDGKLENIAQGQNLLEECRQAQMTDSFTISDKSTQPSSRKPSPPFKTSTLQQEASLKLGFSIRRTMSLAQKLYEAGFITYMRTDSLNLSQQALNQAKQYIVDKYGAKYHRLQHYQSKTKGAQEAHEAIRPTNISNSSITGLDESAAKLYQLIHKRTLACQMTPAEIAKDSLKIKVDESSYTFNVSGQRIIFDGFLKITPDQIKDVLLPECQIGDKVKLLEASIFEKFSSAPSRYSEASLVKKLEELGIGRPSTYAPTISNILDREYVVKGDVEPQLKVCQGYILDNQTIKPYKAEEKWGGSTNRLTPTSLAELVVPFLKEHFKLIMDYEFTSKIEAEFDKIALGELNWIKQLDDFYKDFHPIVEQALSITREEIVKMREVGIDPYDNKVIYARMGKFGPYLQKGTAQDSEDKPATAQLPKDTTIDTVELEQALKMFQLPRTLGEYNDQPIIVKSGPFGPYVENDKHRISLKDQDPFSIDLDQALELIEAKIEEDKNKIVATFDNLTILRGRFGPYITDGQKNAKIPKEFQEEPEQITQAQAKEWFEKTAKAPKKRKRIKK